MLWFIGTFHYRYFHHNSKLMKSRHCCICHGCTTSSYTCNGNTSLGSYKISIIIAMYDFKIFVKFALRSENVQFMGPFVFATANQWWYNLIGILPAACGYVYGKIDTTLRWRYNGHDSVSNHQPHECLLNLLFRRRSKWTSKLRVTGLCVGNSPGTGEFPAQMASHAENVSIWWRHHEQAWS